MATKKERNARFVWETDDVVWEKRGGKPVKKSDKETEESVETELDVEEAESEEEPKQKKTKLYWDKTE